MGKKNHEKGVTLIVVIIVLAFMLTIGVMLVTVTGTGPRVAGNVRTQQLAFNAAEAGFDAAWNLINTNINDGTWTDFSGQYRTTFGGETGLDDPLSDKYFRRKTDAQLVQDVISSADNYIFADQVMPTSSDYTYTVFLIDDEAGALGLADDMDTIMVCIGKGPQGTFSRLEIVIEIKS